MADEEEHTTTHDYTDYYNQDADDYYNSELFEEHDNDPDNPEINTMTSANISPFEVNQFDIKNDTHMNLIYRRMIAGQCFRLPNTPTCPDDIFESWLATYLSEKVYSHVVL